MWLLNTETLQLQDFLGNIPPYAILSHTWADKEVSFQEIGTDVARHTPGYEKIRQSCALARSQQYEYIWIDTCCIDKKSSAELSEAINSMFAWYSNSTVCYVFMSDVTGTSHEVDFKMAFRRSRWFTRGWTLQELLAPTVLKFYNHQWEHIGDRTDLVNLISQITTIDAMYITHEKSIYRASIAARMSWASLRKTTRKEDEAYCLLGIFDINMPLLYGEGFKAFVRLQHEIVRSSDDESLFAWHANVIEAGPFAPNALAFRYSRDILPLRSTSTPRESVREASTMTNRGLRLEVPCRGIPFTSLHGRAAIGTHVQVDDDNYVLLVLNCAYRGREDRPTTIILRRVSHNQYIRFLPCEIMVYERYLMGNAGSKAENLPQLIYIQDLTKIMKQYYLFHHYWEKQPTDVTRCTLDDSAGYVLKDWYISELGDFGIDKTISRSMSIYFHGWSGFAILEFAHSSGDLIIAILKYIHHTTNAKRFVSLHRVPTAIDSLVAAKSFCFAQRDLLHPTDHPIKDVWYGLGTGVVLDCSSSVNDSEEHIDYSLSIYSTIRKRAAANDGS
ncbi:MAG: hypothetical protein Q9213_003124 [Squamulea squamosa]